MKNLGRKIGIFITALIIILLLVNIFNRFFIPVKPVMTVSSNMAPTYEKYDVLFYSKSEDYNVNDPILVTVSNRQNSVTRIIKINEDGTFYAKADYNINSLPFEGSINKNQIVGKIVFSMKPYIFYPIIYIIQI